MERDFIAKRINSLLKQANMSASELSLELGYSRGYIQSLLTGRSLPKMEPFFDICSCFNLTPAQFFSYDLEKSSNNDEALLSKTYEELKKLSEDDLLIILSLAKRLQLLNLK